MEENQNNEITRTRSFSNIWVGVIFILGGAAVLLNQTGILSFELNWWALFILFPSFGAFTGAYSRYRSTNNLFEMGVMMPALIGLFMLFLSLSLLLGNSININWSLYWPVILIIIGLGLIFGRGQKSSSE